MNILYQTIINTIVTQETIQRAGSEVQAPRLPENVSAQCNLLFAAMQKVQELSDRSDIWLLSTELDKNDDSSDVRLGGLLLKIYIEAGAIGRIEDVGYDEVYAAFMHDLHEWILGEFDLLGQNEGDVEGSWERLCEQMYLGVKKAYRETNWMFTISALSGMWVMNQISDWLKVFAKSHRVISCSSGFLISIGDGKLYLYHLAEIDGGFDYALHCYVLSKTDILNTLHANDSCPATTAEDMFDWLYREY